MFSFSCLATIVIFLSSAFVVKSNDISLLSFSMSLPPPLQNEFPTKCFEDLGCFETGEPYFHPIFRPITLLPFDEQYITTKFLLFTRMNPTEPQFLDHSFETISRSSFNPYCPTKILIHGFSVNVTDGGEYAIMKNAMLKRGNYNVILVDWSDSNQAPYFQAIANGRVVGAQIARLIHSLQLFKNAIPERFHIIGHSLGAAVAGWAGERIQHLGRITGLDPAGIFFYNSPPPVRLDTTDALFVDVIITNGGVKLEDGLATLEPIGHVNFYPNGGAVQPGCYNSSDDLNEFDFKRNLCSHSRAVMLFIASIVNHQCRFIGTPCEDYQTFLSGKCQNRRFWWRSVFDYSPYSACKRAEMGFDARNLDNYMHSPVGLKYYLKTTEELPFCIQESNYRNFALSRKFWERK